MKFLVVLLQVVTKVIENGAQFLFLNMWLGHRPLDGNTMLMNYNDHFKKLSGCSRYTINCV